MTKLTINPAEWVRASTAAKLIGVKRQAIYYHLRSGHIEQIEIDSVHFVRRKEIRSLKRRPQSKH